MAKLTLTALGVMPIPEAVSIPFFTKSIASGVFTPSEAQDKSAVAMLDELARWAGPLATMRG